MSVFMSNAKLRRLQLIEYLEDQIQVKTFKEVADHFSTTRRKIYEDLLHIKSVFPEILIKTTPEKIYLQLPGDKRIDYYYQQMIQSSNAFKLLNLLLRENQIERPEAIRRLEISQSSLYRLVQDLNTNLLEDYQLNLQITPLSLDGSEEAIRRFYCQLFSETFSMMDWPYPELDVHQVHQVMRLGAKAFDFHLSFDKVHKWMTRTAINLVRNHYGYYLDLEEDLLNYVHQQIQQSPDWPAFQAAYQAATHLTCTPRLLIECFYPHIHEAFCMDQPKSKQEEANQNTRQAIQDFLAGFTDHFKIELEDTHDLVQDLYETIQLNQQNLLRPLFVSRRDQFIQGFRMDFPLIYDYLTQEITSIANHLNLKPCEEDSLIHQLVYTAIIKLSPLFEQVYREQTKIKALVVTDLEPQQRQFIMIWLKQRMGDLVEIINFAGETPCPYEINKYDCDIIVTNFQLTGIHDRPILWVEEYPSAKNYINLAYMINEWLYLRK